MTTCDIDYTTACVCMPCLECVGANCTQMCTQVMQTKRDACSCKLRSTYMAAKNVLCIRVHS